MGDKEFLEETEISAEELVLRKEIAAEVANEDGNEPILPAEDPPPKEDEPAAPEGEDPPDNSDKLDGEPGEDPDPEPSTDPAALEKITSLEGEIAAKEDRIKQLERRVGSLTNEFAAAKKAQEEAEKKGEKAPTKEEMAKAAESEETWDALIEDYPGWASMFEGKFNEIREELGGGKVDVEALREEIRTDLTGKITEDLTGKFEVLLEKRLISRVHKGWEKTVATDDYRSFVSKLPEGDLKTKALSSQNAEDCIEVLDAYFEQRGTKKTPEQIQAEREKRLKSSTENDGKPPKIPKSDDQMSEAELRAAVSREVFKEE